MERAICPWPYVFACEWSARLVLGWLRITGWLQKASMVRCGFSLCWDGCRSLWPYRWGHLQNDLPRNYRWETQRLLALLNESDNITESPKRLLSSDYSTGSYRFNINSRKCFIIAVRHVQPDVCSVLSLLSCIHDLSQCLLWLLQTKVILTYPCTCVPCLSYSFEAFWISLRIPNAGGFWLFCMEKLLSQALTSTLQYAFSMNATFNTNTYFQFLLKAVTQVLTSV